MRKGTLGGPPTASLVSVGTPEAAPLALLQVFKRQVRKRTSCLLGRNVAEHQNLALKVEHHLLATVNQEHEHLGVIGAGA